MKIHRELLDRWTKYVQLLLHEHNYTVNDVKTLHQAWAIAHRLDIPREAYHMDANTTDTHIETALRRIFPNIQE
jgi:hypothetical protein